MNLLYLRHIYLRFTCAGNFVDAAQREKRVDSDSRTAQGQPVLQGQALGESARAVHDKPQGQAVRREHVGKRRSGGERDDSFPRGGGLERKRGLIGFGWLFTR